MEPLQIQGDAFSEYFLRRILPSEARLLPRLDFEGADRRWRDFSGILRTAQRELRGSRQARVTRRALLAPLARLLNWELAEPTAVVTSLGEEEGSQTLSVNGNRNVVARVLAVPAESSLDLPPEGLHRRFAPSHSLVRILEQEGLTWGILLNAFELRLVRRGEGFVSSHLCFSLLDLAADVPGAREAWRLVWGLLRADAWEPAPAVLEEVVRLGREHQQEVGDSLGQQVPLAVERLLQGAIDHAENREKLQPYLGNPVQRAALLEHLHAGALRYLYRILFVLYAEARGLLPLDMPAYRDGYSLSGPRGLVRRAMDPATDPRRNAEAATGFFELSLRALFQLLRDGVDLGPEGRIPAYGGGLFSTARDANSPYPDFDELTLGDATVAQILDLLTHAHTRRGKVTLSYRELDVEQLGALYEGLLERAVDYVDECTGPLWRIRLDGDLVLVTEDQLADLRRRRGEVGAETAEEGPEAEDDEEDVADAAELEEAEEAEEAEASVAIGKKKPIRVLPSAPGAPNPIPVGSVILRPGLGRKQTGSYYTNSAFVEYLVREAIDPLAEGKRPEEILELAVCDPAMGSGHFLVGACRRLAEHLLVAYKARYAEEAARAEARGEERSPHELLLEAGIHAELAAVWGNEPAELTVCRRLVAFHCLYGVDKNPLAVELARVSLWLATAASDHPLTFLNHRLVPGDSLLGVTVDDLLRPFLPRGGKRRKADEKPLTGDRDVLAGYGGVASEELHRRLRQSFRFLREIERLETEQPGDFEDQQQAYLAMRQELEDFIDGHALRVGRAFLGEDNAAAHPEVANQWMKEIQDLHRVTEEIRARAAAAVAKGRELRAFCWELAFPERFFEPDPESDGVRRRERPGFDAMLGNPPWEKIKPAKKEFFAQYDPAIRDYQGQSLNQRIAVISRQNPEAPSRWQEYESQNKQLAALLLKGGIYEWQIVEVNGEKTGGDPDLFKLFLERFHQLVRPGGRVGVLMPAGLYALEGATGLRQLLFSQAKVEAIYSFENAFERFFPNVDSRMKFLTLVFTKEPATHQSFPAAFMLRNEKFLSLPKAEREARSVRITSDYIRLTSPGYLSLVEVRDDRERQFIERIYRAVPPLGKQLKGPGEWNVEFRTEFHMTNDAWRFRTRQWLEAYGCEKRGSSYVAPQEEWYQARQEFVPGVRYIVPEGNKYHITSEEPPERERRRGARGRGVEVLRGYLLADRDEDRNELPVIPGATYVPLYEGRMVHQFDHAAKAYVSGEGRGAKWRDLDFTEKEIIPHFYVDGTHITVGARAGFCDVTGQTNERSLLAALIPAGHPAGNKVPTISTSPECQQVWLSVANSFLVDFLIRQKISTTINFFYLEGLPLFRPKRDSDVFQRLRDLAARLVSITPEIQLAEPALDPRERARLRAEMDAIVAGLYGLTPAEFAYILTTFPLLDRDQPPLPGDAYVRWNKQGKPKLEPRSFVTRDTALLAYFRHLGLAPPEDLAAWYRDEVGVDMLDDETCPYRMGPIRNLEARVAEYHRRGAIAYLPSKAKRWDPNGPYQPLETPSEETVFDRE
ncbi:MAG TPA: hypothetical protein PLA43_19715 [Bryobacteraceae bacterium]|nr:hypothetical protein [Bryobacteraceae bacterium]